MIIVDADIFVKPRLESIISGDYSITKTEVNNMYVWRPLLVVFLVASMAFLCYMPAMTPLQFPKLLTGYIILILVCLVVPHFFYILFLKKRCGNSNE